MEIDPENAPPAVVMLAVKIYDGVAGPGGPATALADEYALTGSRCFEYDDIGVELVKLTVPWTGSVRGDGEEFSGEREGGTVIDGVRGSQSGCDFVMEECGGVESRPGFEVSTGILVS
ncbi:unnamed protein product [Malus baccata var. baccata]